MARAPRRESSSGLHHVMNRGVDRQPIFFSDDDRIEFGRQLAWVHEHLGVDTLAYCLMDNHFHLLVRAPDGGLSEAMQRVCSTFARRVNDRIERDGPLFKGRFLSIPVETDAYLVWVTRYIHRNALDLAGVDDARSFRWSSYRSYLGLRAAPGFLDVDTVLAHFDHRPDRLEQFTDDDALDVIFARTSTSTDGPATADVRAIVACGVAVDDLAHGSGEAARRAVERTVLVLLAQHLEDPALRGQVVASLRFPSRGAVRSAVSRAERRRREDPAIDRVLSWCMARLSRDAHEGLCRLVSDPV